MNLNEKEKFEVYKEELEKLKEQQSEESKSKLSDLTDDERQKIFAICYFIVYFMLGLNNVIITSAKIKYSCPFSESQHINFIREEELKEQESTGFIKAKCNKCNKFFHLLVTEDVVKYF